LKCKVVGVARFIVDTSLSEALKTKIKASQ